MEDKKLAPESTPSFSRRDFVSAALGASLMTMVPPGVRSGAWAAGSDAPEKKEVRIGFIPLTDCASVVMASVMKFDEKYGIKIIPTKEASWASVRDKLVNGEIDAAHVPYGLIYGVHLGVGGGEEGHGGPDEPQTQRASPYPGEPGGGPGGGRRHGSPSGDPHAKAAGPPAAGLARRARQDGRYTSPMVPVIEQTPAPTDPRSVEF